MTVYKTPLKSTFNHSISSSKVRSLDAPATLEIPVIVVKLVVCAMSIILAMLAGLYTPLIAQNLGRISWLLGLQ